MQSKLICYQLKIECCNYKMYYASLMVITKEKTYSRCTKDEVKGIKEYAMEYHKRRERKEKKERNKGTKELQNSHKTTR